MRHSRLTNFILTGFTVCAVSAATAFSSYAIDKTAIKEDKTYTWTFDEDEDVWTCENSEGEPVNEWAKKGSKLYYLDDGVSQTGWVKYEGDWYYFYEEDEDSKKSPKTYVGSMASDTWIDNYYVDKDGVKNSRSRNFFK
jgi:hypothetical protein